MQWHTQPFKQHGARAAPAAYMHAHILLLAYARTHTRTYTLELSTIPYTVFTYPPHTASLPIRTHILVFAHTRDTHWDSPYMDTYIVHNGTYISALYRRHMHTHTHTLIEDANTNKHLFK